MSATPVSVHVGIGSNLGERVATVRAACEALSALAVDGEVRRSPLYESAPLGPADQPDYVNAVCAFRTALSPSALLEALLGIERDGGRVRPAPRWSARTLDLDLLLYGERVVSLPDLEVPHPRMAERAFVLRPLLELDPDVEIPGRGPARALLDGLDGAASLRPLPA